jgi:hypothetical protein
MNLTGMAPPRLDHIFCPRIRAGSRIWGNGSAATRSGTCWTGPGSAPMCGKSLERGLTSNRGWETSVSS